MSTVGMQIAERAKKHPKESLTNLHQFIDNAMLHRNFEGMNKKSASGVDEQTWHEYDEQRERRIPELLTAFKSGRYRAPNIRRVYIPKGDGTKRPLGLPTIEDKLLQSAVAEVLTPMYEQIFYDFSYGFREGKSAHQALDQLFKEVSFNGKWYIIDADMKNYFGSIDHQCLREFLDQRIKDGVIRKQIDKWLKAGILEEGEVTYPTEGTPQGGVISPLLSNIYLHYVLDDWFATQVQPLLRGKSCLIRFADDFLICFNSKEDAERVMKVLSKRLGRYGLTLHPEKTKLIELTATGEGETFTFLGFTHYLGRSRKGKLVLKRKTSRKKFTLSLKRMNMWLRNNSHQAVSELLRSLNQKLRGHYSYYGVTFNSRALNNYRLQVERQLFKWLNRRGGKRKWNWARFTKLVNQWMPLERPRIYHSYLLAKP
jgi:group II intron reverse transcriptase/maturase